MATNSTLRELRLEFNAIGAAGAGHVARALQSNFTVRTLRLGFCSVGDGGAARIAEALATNVSLTTLALWGNSIASQGLAHLAQALTVNTSLAELDLHDSRASAEGGQPDGRGTETLVDGSVWTGMWKKGIRHVDPLTLTQLVGFYEKHDPPKVAKVASILKDYPTIDLATALYEKYGVAPEGYESAAKREIAERAMKCSHKDPAASRMVIL